MTEICIIYSDSSLIISDRIVWLGHSLQNYRLCSTPSRKFLILTLTLKSRITPAVSLLNSSVEINRSLDGDDAYVTEIMVI